MSKPPKRAAAKSASKGGARTADEPGSEPGARTGAPSSRVALPTAQEPPDGTDAPQRTPEKAAAGKMSARKTGAKKTGVGKAGVKKAGVKKTSAKKTGLKKNTEKVAARKGGASKTVQRAVRSGSAVLRTATLDGATAGVLDRLFEVVTLRRDADPNISHSARLLSRGTAKVAQKFGEEAVECLIEAVAGNSAKLIGESADVLYHLIVMWVDAGVQPNEIWAELQRREGTSGIAEKAARGTATRPAGE